MESTSHFLSYLIHFFLDLEIFETKVVEEIKTHILCSMIFFLNSAFYEIMWKNTVERGGAQIIVWRMRIPY